QMGKEISTRWKATTTEQRKRFDVLAAEDAIRYKKEVQLWEENKILEARKARELAKQGGGDQGDGNIASQLAMPPGVAALDNQANALLAAAAVRAMDEKNHPDAPQRVSPRLGPAGAMGMPSLQNFSALEMARQQQQQQQTINQMLLANEMQAMQQQALQRQLALGSFPQGPPPNALLLEQLRRQEELALLANAQRQQDPGLVSTEAFLNDYLRLQQQQQLQQQGSLGALRGGGMGLQLPGDLGSFAPGGLNPQASAFAGGTTMQNPFLQSPTRAPNLHPSMGSGAAPNAASQQGANLPVYSGSDADQLALLRRLSQSKPEGRG
ncbi:MAG: hypothetical protein SGILL_008987, partial [Bacillariaceae sp.]